MEFICLDIETTGLDLETNEIIEVAAVKFNQTEILGSFQTFIHYDQEIPKIVEHLTGINKSMTENAPTLDLMANQILEFCGNAPIVGHNINFDINFLNKKGVPLTNTLFDTLPLSQILIQDTPSHSLEVLSRTFNKQYFPTHRAQDDCLANIELFYLFLDKLKNSSPNTAFLFKHILQKSDTEWAKILNNIIPAGQKTELPKNKLNTFAPSNQNTNYQELNGNFQDLITQSKPNTLLVVSENQISNFTSQINQLPELNSEINTEKFENFIQSAELNYDETVLALKIAKLLETKNPVYKQDLNLHGQDYNYLNQLLEENYQVYESPNGFITTHFNFFRLLQSNKLPAFTNIFFDNQPFLEEQFVRASEQRITLHQAEQGQENLALALEFRNLRNFAEKIKATENAEFYDSALINNLTFNDPEFQVTLQKIFESTNSKETKDQIQTLKSNFSQYLIYIRNPQNYYNTSDADNQIATIGFIPKSIDTDFDLQKLANKSQAQNFNSVQQENFASKIFLQTSSNYPDPNAFGYNQFISDQLFEELKSINNQALVISTAKAQMLQIHNDLALKLNEIGITLLTQDIAGSRGKILSNLENNEAPSVLLCSQYFFLKNYPTLEKLEKVLITKLPMSLPNHIFYEYKKSIAQNSFMELIVPNTANTLYQVLNQASQQNPKLSEFKLYDPRIVTKNWGVEISNNLPSNIIINDCQ